jgi:hypothetical protein
MSYTPRLANSHGASDTRYLTLSPREAGRTRHGRVPPYGAGSGRWPSELGFLTALPRTWAWPYRRMPRSACTSRARREPSDESRAHERASLGPRIVGRRRPHSRQPPKSSYVTISCDDATLERAAKIIERDLGLHIVRSGGSSERSAAMFIHSKLLLTVLDSLGFRAGEKAIPGWVLGLPLGRLAWFLEGYREGDGVHSGAKYEEQTRHEFSTTSESPQGRLGRGVRSIWPRAFRREIRDAVPQEDG